MFRSQRFIHDSPTIDAERWVKDCFGRSELRDQFRDVRGLEIDVTPDHRFADSDRLRGINPVELLSRQHTPRFQIRSADDRMLETCMPISTARETVRARGTLPTTGTFRSRAVRTMTSRIGALIPL